MAPGSTLGRYALGEVIGRGGVAEVIRARATGAGGFAKDVVIKRIRSDLRDDADVRAAFAREAAVSQRLGHGNVVQTIDVGEDDGAVYLVLELVDGCTLQAVLDDHHGTAPELVFALHVVEQIAAALCYVHQARDADGCDLGLVHRDVTPANILLGRDGVVKLADFGIARSAALGSDTLPGFIKGTVQYLAPEQAAGRPVDGRADVFSLGLVLRRLLVGDAGTDDLDAGLRAIVESATEPAVRDRMASASVMLDALAAWRVAAKIGDGADAVRAAVARQRGDRGGRVIALDHALVGTGRATRQVAQPVAPPPTRRRQWIVAASLVVIAAGVWGAWAILGSEPVRDGEAAAVAATVSDEGEAVPSLPDNSGTTGGLGPPGDPDATTDAPAPDPLPDAAPDPGPDALPDSPPDPLPDPAPDPKPGAKTRLLVNVVPYAEVTVDGRAFGRTPIDRKVRAGKHTVELYNPETGRRASMRVTTTVDEPLRITHW